MGSNLGIFSLHQNVCIVDTNFFTSIFLLFFVTAKFLVFLQQFFTAKILLCVTPIYFRLKILLFLHHSFSRRYFCFFTPIFYIIFIKKKPVKNCSCKFFLLFTPIFYYTTFDTGQGLTFWIIFLIFVNSKKDPFSEKKHFEALRSLGTFKKRRLYVAPTQDAFVRHNSIQFSIGATFGIISRSSVKVLAKIIFLQNISWSSSEQAKIVLLFSLVYVIFFASS